MNVHPRTVYHGLRNGLNLLTVRPGFLSLSLSPLARSEYNGEMALPMTLVLPHTRSELDASLYLSILDVNCTSYSDNRFGEILKLLPSLQKERACQR